MLLQLRKHKKSKSATQTAALTKASNALRSELVTGLFMAGPFTNQEFNEIRKVSQVSGQADCEKLIIPYFHKVITKFIVHTLNVCSQY